MGENGSADREYGKLYPVARAVLTPPFKFLWRLHVHGAENVPTDGPAVMCPNHTSVIDSFFLPLSLPRRITFVGKAEYMDSWKTKYIFPAMGMIPIDRGELFGIYPEGTRARDGKLHKGHTGPARLSIRTGAPIVPVGIRGTRDIQPPDAKFPRPFKSCEIRFGRPIRPERYADEETSHIAYRRMMDEVMYEIRELSGQEYEDTYATKKAESLPTEVAAVPSIDVRDPAEPVGRRSSVEVLGAR